MENQILTRHVVRVGNSSGVILPKSWLNKQARVELVIKKNSDILGEVLNILEEKSIALDKILGVYLIGSYARGDYDEESDMDVLVITENLDRIINKDNYEIFLISEDNLARKLPKSLYLISAVKEIQPLMNKRLLEKFKDIKSKINIKDYEKEIKRILRINKDMIDTAKEHDEKILDGTAYSLVLRFRELYLIKCILSNKKPDKKEFLNLVGKDIFDAYLRIKRNKKEINHVSVKDANKLYELSEKWLKELKGWKKE